MLYGPCLPQFADHFYRLNPLSLPPFPEEYHAQPYISLSLPLILDQVHNVVYINVFLLKLPRILKWIVDHPAHVLDPEAGRATHPSHLLGLEKLAPFVCPWEGRREGRKEGGKEEQERGEVVSYLSLTSKEVAFAWTCVRRNKME